MKNKKITFSSNTAFSLYNFRIGLMRHLKNLGYEVTAVAPKDEYTELLSKEFRVYSVQNLSRKGTNPLKDFSLMVEYLKIYKKIKPDLVLSYTIKPNIYGSLACGLLGIKSISVVTGLGYVFIRENWLSKIVQNLYRTAFRFNNKIVFLNKEDRELLTSKKIIPSDKSVVILSSGINTEFFSINYCNNSEERKNFVFLMISRLLWDKGVKEFVEAARLIKQDYLNTEFWLLGPIDKGNPSAISKQQVEQWEKERVIKYLGFANDVRQFICKSDIVVLPSYREGIPRVLLEAMAMEKPIVTTDAPGCRDVCRDGINGLLVPIKNTEALKDAMVQLLNMDKHKRRLMGSNGREIVINEYDEKIVIQKYMEIIQKLCVE
jgi:glycosyltransferase involved in cell wall biosynthesis